MKNPLDSASRSPLCGGQANDLALSLVQAERAIQIFTSGQADAVVDGEGQAYLLRPAQERLKQSQERLQALFDRGSEATTIIDRSGMVVLENQASRDMFRGEGLLGRNLFESVHVADQLPLYSVFFNVIEGFLPLAKINVRFPAFDGQHTQMELTAIKLGQVNPPNLVLVCREMGNLTTPQREASLRENVLGEALQAKDQFLAMLSHELRAPLGPILLGLEELQQDEGSTAGKETLSMIQRNLDLQARLLDELTAFVAIGQHKVRLKLEPFEAHQIIGLVLSACRPEIRAAGMEILLDLRATQTVVQADSLKLQQILWNLVKNAVKFSPPGDRITIRTTNDLPGWLTIEVADRGIGIEASLLPEIFDSFRQGEEAEMIHRQGLGLGLFIANGLAEAHGGTLTAFSEGAGRGSVFRLTLAASAGSLP